METTPTYILIVDDEPAHAEAVRRALSDASPSFEVDVADSLAQFRARVATRRPDLVLLDFLLPDGRSEDVLVAPPDVAPFPVVMMTSHGDEAVAVNAIRNGALDYVVKSAAAFAAMPRTVERNLRAWRAMLETRQAREALEFREEIFSTIVNEAEDAMALFDAQTGSFVEFNAAAHEGLGYSRDQFARMRIQDFQADHSPEMIRRNVEASRASAGVSFETRHRHRDGSLRDVRVRLHALRLRDRDFMTAVWTDITDRKRAEARAALEAMRTEFLLELHQHAPQLTDAELVDHVLQQAVQLTGSTVGFVYRVSADQSRADLAASYGAGRPPGGAAGQSSGVPRDPTIWDECVRQQRQVVSNDPVRFMSLPIVQDGGVRLVFSTAGKPSDYDSYDVEQLRVVSNELHKLMVQREGQGELHRSEERFRQLVETTSDMVWEVDTTGRYTYVSPRIESLLGYTVDEVIGRRPFDFMSAAEASRVQPFFAAVVGSARPLSNFEAVLLHKQGRDVRVEVNGAPVFDDGALVAYRGTDRDITERRRLEALFRQAQKLEAVGQLAGGVAHDFNNILGAMMLALGAIEEDCAIDGRAAGLVRDLISEANRAAALTRQLLMFSRRSVIETRPLDVNALVKNLLKMLGRLIGEQTRLELEAQPEGVPAVEADPSMIEQVVMNLVVNARDAMPRGGRVTISTMAETIAGADLAQNPNRREGRFVCLTVADTGSGMNEDTLKRLFEPFFTTKEPGRGTGLGLATVHGIVAQHRGWVEVQSELGTGSQFRVYLPAAVAEATSEFARLEAARRAPRGSETILFVEDEDDLRTLVATVLRGLGYRVYEAANGVAALQQWAAHSAEIQVLLTDMVMPEGLTGLDLAEQMLTLKPTLKVIISSGYSADIVRAGGVDRPGVVYLPKPFNKGVLARALRECLEPRA